MVVAPQPKERLGWMGFVMGGDWGLGKWVLGGWVLGGGFKRCSSSIKLEALPNNITFTLSQTSNIAARIASTLQNNNNNSHYLYTKNLKYKLCSVVLIIFEYYKK